MDVRELATGDSPILAVVFEPGEEPVGGLTSLAVERGIDAASFTAIGAFRSVKLGWLDIEAREYRVNEVGTQCEVVSLVGDITRGKPGAPEQTVHAHVVVAFEDARALGGHLLEARVRPTLEVVVTETPAVLRRRYDPATGLAMIDIEQQAHP